VNNAVQLRLWPAPRIGGLTTDPDEAALGEPFLYQAGPGVWPVGHWSLIPKLGYDGWWFAHWWCGPGTRRWPGTDSELPDDAARPLARAVGFITAGPEREAYAVQDVVARDGDVIQTFPISHARAFPVVLAEAAPAGRIGGRP
jgi:hypothetical protein